MQRMKTVFGFNKLTYISIVRHGVGTVRCVVYGGVQWWCGIVFIQYFLLVTIEYMYWYTVQEIPYSDCVVPVCTFVGLFDEMDFRVLLFCDFVPLYVCTFVQ